MSNISMVVNKIFLKMVRESQGISFTYLSNNPDYAIFYDLTCLLEKRNKAISLIFIHFLDFSQILLLSSKMKYEFYIWNTILRMCFHWCSVIFIIEEFCILKVEEETGALVFFFLDAIYKHSCPLPLFFTISCLDCFVFA